MNYYISDTKKSFAKFLLCCLDAVAIAEKSFNRIEGRIRGTLMNKRFPMVLI